MKQRHPNRQKSKKPSKAKFWCMRCDRSLVGQTGKCRVCGAVNKEFKFKR